MCGFDVADAHSFSLREKKMMQNSTANEAGSELICEQTDQNMITKFLGFATMLFIPGVVGLIWNFVQGNMHGARFWGLIIIIAFIAGTIGGLLMKKR